MLRLQTPVAFDLDNQDWSNDLSASRQRCIHQHHLDPDSDTAPDVVDATELSYTRESLEPTIALAQDELGRLHAMVSSIGYATLLADPQGIILERYCREADADALTAFGTRVGARWTEEAQGTNGIGTCVIEQRPLNVHRQQHFRHHYSTLSCSAAPIFDADGKLKAILNVVSRATEISDRSHAMALTVIADCARAIQEREFRTAQRRHWILALQSGDGEQAPVLLAVDKDQIIVAVEENTRSVTALGLQSLQCGVQLKELFEHCPQFSAEAGDEDQIVSFLTRDSGKIWRGIATPPQRRSVSRRSASQNTLHSRPRSARLQYMRTTIRGNPIQSGLPPKVFRSARQYIESNLGRNLSVEELARMTGLSASHFSRQFKHSAGISPHHYVTRQRIEMASRLLLDDDRALADIAQITGFSDQSHFTRCFTRLIGCTPGSYRHSKR
ncbi:MAG: helix-turn-helix domain-containing protein [Pseudomonadota bacterium]